MSRLGRQSLKARIGLVTVGQSPRNDITAYLMPALGDRVEFLEAGALDDITTEEYRQIGPRNDDELLQSRMRDGSTVSVRADAVIPLLQQRILELEAQDVALTLVMCTGALPRFRSSRLVLVPQTIVTGMIEGILPAGKLAVICPSSKQVASTHTQFRRHGIELHVDWLPPYDPNAPVEALAERLRGLDVDLVLLDCFGFSPEVKQTLSCMTGKPVVLPVTLMAQLLSELVD